MKALKNLLLILLISFVALVSCEKEEPEDVNIPAEPVTTTDLSGFGNRQGSPSVTSFELPLNIEISQRILADDTGIYNNYGVGMGGLAFFTITNNSNINIDVIFPERLVIIADNDSAQNNILLYPLKISLLANESKKISLRMFCINQDKPTWNANYYQILGQSNNNQIFKLTNSLEYKSESLISEHYGVMQNILWNITDKDSLTQANLDTISAW